MLLPIDYVDKYILQFIIFSNGHHRTAEEPMDTWHMHNNIQKIKSENRRPEETCGTTTGWTIARVGLSESEEPENRRWDACAFVFQTRVSSIVNFEHLDTTTPSLNLPA